MQSEHLLACEQAPKWGKEKSTSRASGELWGEEERKLIPHLGASVHRLSICLQPVYMSRMTSISKNKMNIQIPLCNVWH